MDSFLENVEKYELLLELILTAVSLFISVFVVIQTKNLAKRQAKQDLELAERQAKQEREIAGRQNQLQKWQTIQEREIAEMQNELQKRQIKLELFERKFKTKVALKQVFDVSRIVLILEDNSEETYLLKDEDKILNYIRERIKELDKREFSEIFSRAKYIFDQILYDDIDYVYFWFDHICSMLDMMETVKDSRLKEHYDKYKEMIFSSLKEISEKENSLIERIEKELDISQIDK